MRWFKKKTYPFDNHFSILVQPVPDPPVTRHLQFVVPSWYYAQLIFLKCRAYIPTIPLADPTRHLWGYVTRGGNLSFGWDYRHGPKSGVTYTVMCGVGLESWSTNLASPFPYETPLPDYCYVYPGDIIHYQITTGHVTDKLSDVVLTLKIWEI